MVQRNEAVEVAARSGNAAALLLQVLAGIVFPALTLWLLVKGVNVDQGVPRCSEYEFCTHVTGWVTVHAGSGRAAIASAGTPILADKSPCVMPSTLLPLVVGGGITLSIISVVGIVRHFLWLLEHDYRSRGRGWLIVSTLRMTF